MNAFKASIVATLFCALFSVSAHAATVILEADLEGSSEVPPTTGSGRGQLKGTFDTETRTLKWTVNYEGLSGPATAAHFHGPAPIGQNARIQVPIDPYVLPSPILGSAVLSVAQSSKLMHGQWYFNIHTGQNRMGEIRGQVIEAN